MIRKLQKNWDLEKIKVAVDKFYEINGRYPVTHDFDKNLDYMPNSRMIQRKFGGIRKLREQPRLPIEIDYTKGERRSKQASETYSQSKRHEENFYIYLTTKIPEVFVHEHKIIRPSGRGKLLRFICWVVNVR